MRSQYYWNTIYCGNGCGEILTMRLAKGKGPLEHVWSKPEYSWSDDYAAVTAKRVCTCVPDNPHAETETAAVKEEPVIPATCEQGGRYHLTASFKNAAFKEQSMDLDRPATGPKWDEGTVTEEATCTKDGLRTYTCLNDKSHTKTEVIKATGHVAGRHALKDDTSTCTEHGTLTAENICLRCGEVLGTEKETALSTGHNWDEPTYTVNQDEEGNLTLNASHICQDCRAGESETVGLTYVVEDHMVYSDEFENIFFTPQEFPFGGEEIEKAKNPLTVAVTEKNYKATALTSKARSFTIKTADAQGKVTFETYVKARNAGITVSSKGKVTIPKNCRAGTYTLKVRAAGNSAYKAKNIIVTVTVR